MDTIRILVLADGTIKSTTDPISPELHQTAEDFLTALTTLTGGDATREHRGEAHHHHAHEHVHQGEK
jgi:hypothetical protein